MEVKAGARRVGTWRVAICARGVLLEARRSMIVYVWVKGRGEWWCREEEKRRKKKVQREGEGKKIEER